MNRRTLVPFGGVILGVWFLFFLHSCTAPPTYRELFTMGEITRAPPIRIGISTDSTSVAVRGPGRIQGGHFEDLAPSEVRLRDGAIELSGRLYEGEEVRISPEEEGTLVIGSKRYRGSLILRRDRNRISLINEVDLESYVKGVAGKEMSPSSHPEALKAQMIAARTYAMYEVRNQTLRKVKGEKFDLYDDERSQVYGGMERETESISRLVEQTTGLFLVWNERIFKAFYSSTCGGNTEPAWIVMGDVEKIPPLAGTRCDYCEGTQHYKWSRTFAMRDVARKLFPDDPKARIESVRVTKKLPGGHAAEIGVRLENRSKEFLFEANKGFRRALDPRALKSTLWEEPVYTRDELVIRGRGFGHGCGMCQWGAYRMAESGKSAIQILQYYFPGADIKKLY